MGMDSVENGDHIGGLLPWKVSRPSHRLGNPPWDLHGKTGWSLVGWINTVTNRRAGRILDSTHKKCAWASPQDMMEKGVLLVAARFPAIALPCTPTESQQIFSSPANCMS